MPVFQLPDDEFVFPDPRLAEAEGDLAGLLSVGGGLEPERLMLAYRSGIFPWYGDETPILWWSPDPRFVLRPGELHVPRSLAKRMRQGDYELTLDEDFAGVIEGCAAAPRPGQDGTWITDEMQAAYVRLHELGHAHSCEAWQDDRLVGGVYGVAVGGVFAAESMFYRADDASKIALVALVRQLAAWGVELIDAQLRTPHVARFGGREIPREDYLDALDRLAATPLPPAPWRFDDAQPPCD